ncbi:AI-2E family transporter [Mesorhizobium sp. J428]|uniref:AI-2E family transporter n=1 Tax=Mesorhizobium sp. J428 TaxID=2898440 RepID=UPI002150EE4D|nr:AI-2E family transporter [Mesorhizobium sp. J428]MCR5857835.1 AI-2E family transporter [Mesorhizobium sp. J428]
MDSVEADKAVQEKWPSLRGLVLGIFIILLFSSLYFAREFFMPVVLAFLFALTLTPIVRFLRKRGIPSPISATLLVFFTAGSLAIAGYLLSGPVTDLVNEAPQIGSQIRERLSELRGPIDRLLRISRDIDEATDNVTAADTQRVVVQQPGIISRAAGNLLSAGTTIAITLMLTVFLLASGTLFYEKIVQSFGTLSDKKRALRIVYDVEREISRYLLTVAVINFCLGAAIGLGLWAIGMPMPFVWGAAAALLNFLPYIGAAMTIIGVSAVSLVSFETLTMAAIPPAFVLMCNIIEGQIVTPVTVGRRLELNAVAVFIAVAFWSWLWGFIGALIAVPILVIIKVFCDHFDELRPIGNFLAAHQAVEPPEPAAEPVREPT